MKFSETLKDAADILKSAVPDMAQHRVAVNPYNYGLWYTHFTGSSPTLSKEIKRIYDSNEPLTPERSIELFKKFVINDLLVVDKKLEDSYQSVMDSVSESANKTEQSTGNLEQQLIRSLRHLENSDTSDELMTVINTIAEKTRLVSETTREFRHVLNDAQSEITRLKEELKVARAAAEKDPLTKLYNRRYFDNSMETALINHKAGEPLALILIDVDHFKKFNDNYGHLMGDLVLKTIAKVLTDSCVDTNHIACRFGGEEFALILPKSTMREAKILAENILKKISSLTLKDKKSGAAMSKVTASLGLSCADPDDSSTSLIDRADKALYKAKENGRNQIISF